MIPFAVNPWFGDGSAGSLTTGIIFGLTIGSSSSASCVFGFSFGLDLFGFPFDFLPFLPFFFFGGIIIRRALLCGK